MIYHFISIFNIFLLVLHTSHGRWLGHYLPNLPNLVIVLRSLLLMASVVLEPEQLKIASLDRDGALIAAHNTS
jgi:hypothetical protein